VAWEGLAASPVVQVELGCSSSGDAGSRVGESRGEESHGAGGVELDGGVG
jgi:hypothetical protein